MVRSRILGFTMKLKFFLLLVFIGCVHAEEAHFTSEFATEINSGAKINGEFWARHGVGYVELAYFVLRGESDSVEAIAHLIVNNWSDRRQRDDHLEISYLARVLSLNEMSGSILNAINTNLCREVSEYYIEFQEDFVGQYNAPWESKWCQ